MKSTPSNNIYEAACQRALADRRATIHATGHVQTDDEKSRDLRHAAGLLAQLSDDDKGAAAYDHVAHGPCPFEESDIDCPVGCDAPQNIALDARAFFSDATGYNDEGR